mgnify:CR=1 FL=1
MHDQRIVRGTPLCCVNLFGGFPVQPVAAQTVHRLCGFLSNSAEAEKLCDEEYQERVAWAIHMGISIGIIEAVVRLPGHHYLYILRLKIFFQRFCNFKVNILLQRSVNCLNIRLFLNRQTDTVLDITYLSCLVYYHLRTIPYYLKSR